MKKGIGLLTALLLILLGVTLAQRFFHQSFGFPAVKEADKSSNALVIQDSGPSLSTLRSPLPTPTPTPIPTPTATRISPTPTVPPGPLPPGPNVVYKENADGETILWEVSAVAPERRKQLAILETPSDFGTNVTLSHDGTRAAYTTLPAGVTNNRFVAELWVQNLQNSTKRQIASSVDIGRYINYPIWSPDDRFLVFSRRRIDSKQSGTSSQSFVSSQSIQLIDLETGVESTLIHLETTAESEIAVADQEIWLSPLDWSPDGRYFYYMTGNAPSELWRINMDNAYQQEYVRRIWDFIPRCYFISSVGESVACTVLEGRNPTRYAVIRVPTTPDGNIEVMVQGAAREEYNPIWSSDKEEMTINIPAQGNERAQLRTIDIPSRQEHTIVVAADSNGQRERYFVPLAWSPNEEWLAAVEYSDEGTSMFVIGRNGAIRNRIEPTSPPNFVGWLANDPPSDIP
ncbi:MAG: PD40 domain-containing protein [Caldilineaceae bacterium]|nr:PD40 domain-containing protein [Caldilineaceae bacterium]